MDDSSLEGTLDTVEFTLINLVKEYPELYNTHDPAYRDKQRKDLAWAEIARHMSKDEGWCYAKWKNLSDYYKKRRKIYGNGASMTMRRWVYYDAFSFLDNYDNIRENVSSRSSTEYHQGYFDETQYHSLDGITSRSDVKLQHFLEPLVEVETNCPPSKKQRVTAIATTYNPTESTSSKSNRQAQETLRSDTVTNYECDNDDDDDDEPIPVIAVLNKPPSSQTHISNFTTSTKTGQTCVNASTVMTNSLDDCPHYHFCMSLAARFRKMDPATATFTQMKIMELFFKTEFPDQYRERVVDD